jgi:hypothetical protein
MVSFAGHSAGNNNDFVMEEGVVMGAFTVILSVLALGAISISVYVVVLKLQPPSGLSSLSFSCRDLKLMWCDRRRVVRSRRDRRQRQTTEFPLLSDGVLVYHDRRRRPDRRRRNS